MKKEHFKGHSLIDNDSGYIIYMCTVHLECTYTTLLPTVYNVQCTEHVIINQDITGSNRMQYILV